MFARLLDKSVQESYFGSSVGPCAWNLPVNLDEFEKNAHLIYRKLKSYCY